MDKKGFKVVAHSNNVVEYATLDLGLQVCLQFGIQRLRIKGDSMLVVKQVLALTYGRAKTLVYNSYVIKSKVCLKSSKRGT